MAGPLLFCGEMADGRPNRLNVGMVHVNRDRSSAGQAISLLVRDDSDNDEKSGNPLRKIDEESRCGAIVDHSVSPTAH